MVADRGQRPCSEVLVVEQSRQVHQRGAGHAGECAESEAEVLGAAHAPRVAEQLAQRAKQKVRRQLGVTAGRE